MLINKDGLYEISLFIVLFELLLEVIILTEK